MIHYKNFILGMALFASGQVGAGEIYNGKTTAMSGVGIAGSDFKNGVLLNPALAARFGEKDDFGFNLNVGALASDQDELIDTAEDIEDSLDLIDGQTISQQTADNLIALLREADGSVVQAEVGGNLQLSIPNRLVSAVFFVNTTVDLNVKANINDADIALLNNAVTNATVIDENNFVSTMTAVGALVAEYGVTLARHFTLAGREFALGVSPKIQDVETYDYSATVANFDDDDFDADQYRTEDDKLNIDFGVHMFIDEKWQLGATLKNLVKGEYKTATGRELVIEPQLSVGGAYQKSWLLAEIDLDINPVENISLQEDTQFLRLGFEFDAANWAQLRLGFRHDLESTLDDTVSAGVGFSPFDVVNIDIAGVYGENDTYGGSVQLGFAF